MKAMILAAGLGQRMRPLTDHLPKPLLPVAGKPLLQYHLENLQQAGVREVIINLAWLGEKIRQFAGDGSRWGVEIIYSPEPEPLETGGALLHAMPLLGEAPVLLINGDVFCNPDFSSLARRGLAPEADGHLVMVPNPDFHPAGDFYLPRREGLIAVAGEAVDRYTFAGISILRPSLIATYPERRPRFPLVEVFRRAIVEQKLTAGVYDGLWSDVGTPGRLAALDRELSAPASGRRQDSILKS